MGLGLVRGVWELQWELHGAMNPSGCAGKDAHSVWHSTAG